VCCVEFVVSMHQVCLLMGSVRRSSDRRLRFVGRCIETAHVQSRYIAIQPLSTHGEWNCSRAEVRPVELTARVARVARAAGGLAGACRLSGADVVQLAGALALDDDEVVMAVWDRRLHAGAVATGLRVAPPSLHT